MAKEKALSKLPQVGKKTKVFRPVPDDFVCGTNCVIGSLADIGKSVIAGNNVYINGKCEGDNLIGDGCKIYNKAILHKGVSLGNYSVLQQGSEAFYDVYDGDVIGAYSKFYGSPLR